MLTDGFMPPSMTSAMALCVFWSVSVRGLLHLQVHNPPAICVSTAVPTTLFLNCSKPPASVPSVLSPTPGSTFSSPAHSVPRQPPAPCSCLPLWALFLPLPWSRPPSSPCPPVAHQPVYFPWWPAFAPRPWRMLIDWPTDPFGFTEYCADPAPSHIIGILVEQATPSLSSRNLRSLGEVCCVWGGDINLVACSVRNDAQR